MKSTVVDESLSSFKPMYCSREYQASTSLSQQYEKSTSKLINILKRVKTKTGLDSNTYKSMYPTGCVPPKFYGLPKIHKPDTPLRPIVSSCGSVTYGVAKELAKILKPLVGKSPHHITSTQDFVEQAKHIKCKPEECLSSYDVSAISPQSP